MPNAERGDGMAIYNREDPRTALPQLEKTINEKIEASLDYKQYIPTFHQCTNGAYTRCFKVGHIAMLSFNINITTGSVNYDYMEGIPKAVGNFGCCATGDTGTARIARFRVTEDGTLRSDGTPTTGWHNGSVVYITKE